MKNHIVKTMIMAMLLLPLGLAVPTIAATPDWNVAGVYVMTMDYLGNPYPHDMTLAQDGSGNLTGNGGSPAGANVYTWVITTGSVSGNSIDFFADYTATPDAVTPLTIMHITGTVAIDGTMSGTWTDNYQAGDRAGTWTTTSGNALALGILAAEDFGVLVNHDNGQPGQGLLTGYATGFGLSDATFAGASSVEVKLYAAGDVLLQTNTAILPTFNADVTGTQFSSPFDVSGAFNYPLDGYWINLREVQYGQSVSAVKVVATVTLANGKVVTAENTILTGDPATIFTPLTGSLIVEKDTIGGNGIFTFTSNIPENSSFSITTTGNTGSQTFNNLVPGVYSVTETNVPKKWTQTDTECSSVTVVAGETATCAITNTKNRLLDQIRGFKFEDKNGDGKLNHGFNRRLSGWTIYIDTNNNSALDSGEPSTVTDMNGSYRFSNLVAGTYIVREVGQSGWTQTMPASGSYTVVLSAGKIAKNKNFGNLKLNPIIKKRGHDYRGNHGNNGFYGWGNKDNFGWRNR